MMLSHLRNQSAPFVLRRGNRLRLEDEAEHREAYRADARRYALSLLAEGVAHGQRARGLFQLLAGSRKGFSTELRDLLDRVVAILGAALPADEVLRVFLAVKRERANHKHTRRAILGWILDHPALEDMAARRRPALVDCIEHAAGVDVARACVNQLAGNGRVDDAYVRRNLLRFGADEARSRMVLTALYRRGDLLRRSKADYRAERLVLDRIDDDARPTTVTATNRGDISATLVHLYRGGTDPALAEALDDYVLTEAAQMPRFEGRLALVLDASGSTRGYGEREYTNVAQAVALRLVLEQCVRELVCVTVGGDGAQRPRPQGATDLAMGVLDALSVDPDAVLVVTDGYENTFEGDLGDVLDALPGAGVDAPVIVALNKFTWKDNLTLRRPAHGTELVEMWNQRDFRSVALTAFTLARGEAGANFLNLYLERRLLRLEKENVQCLPSS